MPPHKSEASIEFIKFVIDQIQLANKPIADELGGMRRDIAKVSGQLTSINTRIGEHSDFMDRARPHIEALERKQTEQRRRDDTPGSGTLMTRKARKMHWAIMLIAGGALTWAGERGVQVLINSLAEKPVAVVQPGHESR